MTTYALYLESGPRHMKTMVHVPELLGCVVTGPTTEEALEATPGVIRQYLAFLARHGLPVGNGAAVDPTAPFEVTVAEHVTGGGFLGQGGLDIIHRDLEPIDDAEIEVLLDRAAALTAELATWAAMQPHEALDTQPEHGRSARAILLHVLEPVGPYLSLAVGGVPGHHGLHTSAKRGLIGLPEALERATEAAAERIRATTIDQRHAVIRHGKDAQRTRTLRSSLRHWLEHHWEHLLELSRRPGGPSLPGD